MTPFPKLKIKIDAYNEDVELVEYKLYVQEIFLQSDLQ